MESNLRYIKKDLNVATYFDFSEQKGFLTAIEQCNGSGDCRKPFKMGGLMCPTYKVTNDERFSTRARANIMREYLINPQKIEVQSTGGIRIIRRLHFVQRV